MPGPSSCPISSDFDFLDPDVNLKALPVAELAELPSTTGEAGEAGGGKSWRMDEGRLMLRVSRSASSL